jgi:hypothetical protein
VTEIGPYAASDTSWAETLLDADLGGHMQARRGDLTDRLGDGGFVAPAPGGCVDS